MSILPWTLVGLPAVAGAATWLRRRLRRRTPVEARVRAHLGLRSQRPVSVSREFPKVLVPVFQRAIDWIDQEDCVETETIGISSDGFIAPLACSRFEVAGRRTISVPVRRLVCRRFGDGRRDLVRVDYPSRAYEEELTVTWYGTDPDGEEAFFDRLEKAIAEVNPYRGACVELESPEDDDGLHVRPIPEVDARDLALPDGVLELLDRNVLSLTDAAAALCERGIELKRGILIHGPMGCGKTTLAHYLMRRIPRLTSFHVAGSEASHLCTVAEIARLLQPSLILLDDVDLMISDREGTYAHERLGDLIGVLDRYEADDRIVLIITTNAPERLDPSLLFRPGRVDQSIGLGMPGDAQRRALVDLYAEKWRLDIEDPDALVAETSEMTPATIREVLRKGAMIDAAGHADPGGRLRVTQRSLRVALDDVAVSLERLGRPIRGFAPPARRV